MTVQDFYKCIVNDCARQPVGVTDYKPFDQNIICPTDINYKYIRLLDNKDKL